MTHFEDGLHMGLNEDGTSRFEPTCGGMRIRECHTRIEAKPLSTVSADVDQGPRFDRDGWPFLTGGPGFLG